MPKFDLTKPTNADVTANSLKRIAEATERLAEHFAPADEGLQSVDAVMAGACMGFADMLEEILNESKNDFEKSSKLRELVERVLKIADNHAKKQTQKDQARAAKAKQ